MADTTRSDFGRGTFKRGTSSVKTKRKQPFVLSFSSPTQTGEGLKRNIERMK